MASPKIRMVSVRQYMHGHAERRVEATMVISAIEYSAMPVEGRSVVGVLGVSGDA
jgi:hypothetical protein